MSDEMELFERATIPFQSPREARQVIMRLNGIAQTLSCKIHYTESTRREIQKTGVGSTLGGETIGIEIEGTIMPSLEYMRNGAILMPFHAYRRPSQDLTLFDGIRFQTTPGYGINDIPKGELEMMDAVREHLSSH